jgi:hypothetical protein
MFLTSIEEVESEDFHCMREALVHHFHEEWKDDKIRWLF